MTEGKEKDTRWVAKTNRSPQQFEVSKAEGCYLYDHHGDRYIDFLSGICVNNFGHGHPEIVRAYKEQLDRYSFTMVYGEHVQRPQWQWAELFLESFPDFDQVYYLTTGTETVEASMKLAKRATGRSEIIAMRRSYHGSTQGSLSLMDDQEFTGRYRPLLPGVRHIRYGEKEDVHQISSDTAAVISEVYQSATGITIPEDGYHRALRQRCDEVGALLIYDEIQTGFGRCGDLMAHTQVGATPDLLCLAKAMGGGLPVAALVARDGLHEYFTHDPVFGHISTMGGHPVPLAGAVAAWKLLVETDLLQNARARASQIHRSVHMEGLAGFRQKGLYMALEFDRSGQAQRFYDLCLEHHLFVGKFFFNERAIRLTPPLTISEELVAEACHKINHIIAQV